MCGLFFTAAVCSLFLPETLYQKLPDSLAEARNFGANQVMTYSKLFHYLELNFKKILHLSQKFWSIPRQVKNRYESDLRKDETEELNQTKFAP